MYGPGASSWASQGHGLFGTLHLFFCLVLSDLIKIAPTNMFNQKCTCVEIVVLLQVIEGMVPEEKREKQKYFCFLFGTNPRPGPDGPRASDWYGRLHEPISPLLLLNSDQLWQLFFCRWIILISTVVYDLDPGIVAKYSKRQTSFYSMQASFRFHSLRCSEILVSPCICTNIRTWRFHRTRGYGLGQITWWIMCWQAGRCHIRNKLHKNREIVAL